MQFLVLTCLKLTSITFERIELQCFAWTQKMRFSSCIWICFHCISIVWSYAHFQGNPSNLFFFYLSKHTYIFPLFYRTLSPPVPSRAAAQNRRTEFSHEFTTPKLFLSPGNFVDKILKVQKWYKKLILQDLIFQQIRQFWVD